MDRARGFTLIELAVTLVVLSVLVAIGLPNFIRMQDRAKESDLKSNMHVFQVVAEDYAVQNQGLYPPDAATVAALLPASFNNPFDHSTGAGGAWETRAQLGAAPSPVPGITSYADSAGKTFNLKGYGSSAPLELVLSSGQ